MSNFLISPLVEQQLPEFVRGEYSTFVTFLEKYYEWMEQSGNVVKAADEIKNAQDVDLTTNYYIEEIQKEFLPYFPQSITLDKRKFLKLINQFYTSKGTPNSVKFLFRALYNEEIDIYYPKDDILIASDGKWVLPLALRLDTDDNNIFNITKCLLTGQLSKAAALVEKVTRSIDRQLGVSYVEVYISNVQKLFQTGETVFATYNDGINDVTVTARLIGALSEIKIDPQNRGLFYNPYDTTTGYAGDPVTIVGGLNPVANTPIGAVAYVGETTSGGITDVIVSNGGFGFRDPATDPNTSIIDFTGGFETASFGTESKAKISLLDETTYRTMNVLTTSIETLLTAPISNVENNAISSISTFSSFNVYPISFVTVDGSGGGYRAKPSVDVYSFYREDESDVLICSPVNIVKGTSQITDLTQDLTLSFDVGDVVRLFLTNRYEELKEITAVTTNTISFADPFPNDINSISVYKVLRSDLRKLGSLGRIEITNGGTNYGVGEYLIFTGGTGYGANARVKEVHASNNGIKSVEFLQTSGYVIGGEGYTKTTLPTITINTASGANATLQVLEINGDGETLNLTTSRIGAISKLRVISYGYDYTSAPSISLRNADMVVSNVTSGQLFVSNTKVYQGTSNTNTTFTAMVDKFTPSTGELRIFDYKGSLNTTKLLVSDDGLVSANAVSISYYGDGQAKATAGFENGLIRLPGLYINTDGHVSSDKKMQDGDKYHNFSYVINTKKDYNQFKNSLNNIVHPIGTKTFINRIDENSETVSKSMSDTGIIQLTNDVTFNISNGGNNMVSTNVSANIASTINVGDIVILTSVSKRISGTANSTSGSNNITGVSSNFINDIIEGDIIVLSTGNTETVSNVISATSLETQNTINITTTGITINLLFNDTKTVTFVNANTVLVDTAFTTNSSFVTTLVQKFE
jgi:hypothetical protein